jgi:hypothetical protein
MIDKNNLNTIFGGSIQKNSPTFIIFSEKKSSRLEYVCEFIFSNIMNCGFVVSDSKDEFINSTDVKINYSNLAIANTFQILPQGLLWETGIGSKEPASEIRNGLIYFFPNHQSENFHFDIFSAVFYFISRQEEWQNYQKDVHGRFELGESILYKNRSHLRPVVDIWVKEFGLALSTANPLLTLPLRVFKTIASIDVDNLYAYQDKGLARTFGAHLKDLLRGDFANIARRIKVVSGREKDPFDIYDNFSTFCHNNNIPLFYFFLFKSGTKYDRSIDPRSDAYLKVFTQLKQTGAYFGIHPSYHSSEAPGKISSEIAAFSKKSNQITKISRQHYLRFDIKNTPELLMRNGIVADFSIGFASGPGFRAGTSQPFYYYDFSSEKKRDLLLVPFCAMDGAYFIYGESTAEAAYSSLQKIKEEVRLINGNFTTVFHERTFAEHLYPGFGRMYRQLLLS